VCGITGVFEYRRDTAVPRELVERMTRTLWHRGPDDEGFHIAPRVGLGARRLSIVDVAGGHQPIANEDDSVAVALNGEIYNYDALRTHLLQRGHQLRTRGDTETIVHLYEEYGDAVVERLDGMFAFALHDGRPQARGADGPGRLLLARDRLGKKPLYYADAGGALVFGSELKAILAHGAVPRDLDYEALHHYLSLLVVPAPHSIFKAVKKIPAGCLLICDGHGPRVQRYWEYADYLDQRPADEVDTVAHIRALLEAAVRKRLIGEVPLGVFLSGGLDSSAVAALMAHVSGARIRTFAAGFEGAAQHDERPFARAVADHLGAEHHEVVVQPDLVSLTGTLVRYADEPFAISSAIPTYLVSQEARRHVTVALTGDGGDEVFGGYEHYLYERWYRAYAPFGPVLTPVLKEMASATRAPGAPGADVRSRIGRVASQVQRFVGGAGSSAGARRLSWRSAWEEREKWGLYSAETARRVGPTDTVRFLDSRLPAGHLGAEQQAVLDVTVWLPDEMLAKVDRMTMAASLEARCPLLDYRLVEFMAGVSQDAKIDGVRTRGLKRLLKRAVSDLLPPDVLVRRKHGFNVPLDAWFRTELRSWVAGLLSPEQVSTRGLFEPQAVDALLRRHWSGHVNAGNRIYALVVMELWAQEWLG
jgi:asparagine synthase (glutamine-hydrolysing)